MKNKKKLFLVGSAFLLGLSLTSCNPAETTRNSTTPYGSLDLSSTVATASNPYKTNEEFKLSLQDYYTRLRSKSYSSFLNLVNKYAYSAEFNALKNLVNSTDFSALSPTDKAALSYTEQEIDEATYDLLKKRFSKSLSTSYANSAYGTASVKKYKSFTSKELTETLNKFIDSSAIRGYTISAANFEVKEFNTLEDQIYLNLGKIPSDLLDVQLLDLAGKFYSEKQLYKIADQEFLNEGTNEEKKNSYYLFNEATYKSTYKDTYYKYGQYNAIIIQFNTLREAKENIEDVMNAMGITEINDDNVANFYINLYNKYYSYRSENTTSTSDDEFVYNVTPDYNELSNVSTGISTLVSDTLENGEYLTEARNISNKYVLAYHISTVYSVSNSNKQIEFDKLKDELSTTRYNELEANLKRKITENNGSTYQSIAFKEYVKANEIKIYDPLFENKFRTTYVDEYDLINKDDFQSEYVFSIGDYKYKVEDFYNITSVENGASILNDYFQQSYVYQFYGDYITDDKVNENKSTLSNAISEFNKGNNGTYPSEIGLETFLVSSYGYRTEEDVLKYYYISSSALTSYKAKMLFDEWSKGVSENGSTRYELSDSAKNGYLAQILAKGNDYYKELFNINIDHILINIDDDGDGSPDDPATFLDQKDTATITKFQNAVTELAKAIYTEATNAAYADNSLFDTLSYIVKEYNKGSSLLSNPSKTWDDYKEFNFLLKAEQLASDGDITQESSSNFVKPFADYIKETYKVLKANDVTIDKDYGKFVLTANQTFAGGVPTSSSDISFENLCATSYGYHLLVVNSYSGPSSLKFTKEGSDTTGEQAAIQILLNEGDDKDSDDDNIYVTLPSYNDNADSASFEQLFIYYCQKKMGKTSTLDSAISNILEKLFADPIKIYESSDFQTLLLLDKLNITATNTSLNSVVAASRQQIANTVISYDTESRFLSWVDPASTIDWSRPDNK